MATGPINTSAKKEREKGKRLTKAEPDLPGQTIRRIKKERTHTHEQPGALVGVKKSPISKIGKHLTDARFETILKVFRALNTRISFLVELEDIEMI